MPKKYPDTFKKQVVRRYEKGESLKANGRTRTARVKGSASIS